MTLGPAGLLFLAAVFWTAAVGYGISAPLLSGLGRGEKIAWGFASGILVQAGLYLGLLSLRNTLGLGVAPGSPAMLAAGGLLLLAALGMNRFLRGRTRGGREASPPFGGSRDLLSCALMMLAAAAAIIFLLEAISEPLWHNDYLAIWGLKSKTIFLSRSIPERLFHDPETAWSHPEYPLLLPVALAALSAVAGSWNDHALALFFPLGEAALLLALYGYLRRRASTRGAARGAAAAACLTALFFPLFQAPRAGTAEIPFAFAILLVSTATLDLIESGAGAAAGRLALASCLACGTKQEGSLFVVILAVWLLSLAVFRRRRIPLAAFAALLLPAAANWAILRAARGALADRDFDLTYLHPGRFPELLERLGTVFGYLWRAEILPIIVPLAAIAGFLLLTPRRPPDLILPPLAAQTAVYASACALSAFGPIWQAQNSFARIAGALFPALALVVGARVSGLSSRDSSPEEEGMSRQPARVRRR